MQNMIISGVIGLILIVSWPLLKKHFKRQATPAKWHAVVLVLVLCFAVTCFAIMFFEADKWWKDTYWVEVDARITHIDSVLIKERDDEGRYRSHTEYDTTYSFTYNGCKYDVVRRGDKVDQVGRFHTIKIDPNDPNDEYTPVAGVGYITLMCFILAIFVKIKRTIFPPKPVPIYRAPVPEQLPLTETTAPNTNSRDICGVCGAKVGDGAKCSECGMTFSHMRTNTDANINTVTTTAVNNSPKSEPGLFSAYKKMFKNYVVCKGRSRRYEFWGALLMGFIIMYGGTFAFAILQHMIHGSPSDTLTTVETVFLFVFGAYIFLTIVPFITLTARRLHDTGRSGWNMVWTVVPLGIFILLWFLVSDSQQGTNEYGDNPKNIN